MLCTAGFGGGGEGWGGFERGKVARQMGQGTACRPARRLLAAAVEGKPTGC